MQDYCGEYKNQETLEMGLGWLASIRESEAARAYARNPHELWRTLEVMVRMTVGEMIIHASLARRASSRDLDFWRLDYPEIDPPEWKKFITTRLHDGVVRVGELPLGFWLEEPYAPSYTENYRLHCSQQ
jgi:succinate dehydrogenase/fumarate reductase flavoprotein subunit